MSSLLEFPGIDDQIKDAFVCGVEPIVMSPNP